MTLSQLAAKLAALSPEKRQIVESLVELLARPPTRPKQRDLAGHPSFGAWAEMSELPANSNDAARELRKRAVRRGKV